MDKEKFEQELTAAYAANTRMNLDLSREFIHVDRACLDIPSPETMALINEALRISLGLRDS